MPTFANPYEPRIPQPMTNAELAQAVRLDLASELEAIYLYEAHILATDDEAAKKVLGHIRDEEKEHLGELLMLLQYLDPDEGQHYADGASDAANLLMQLGIDAPSEPAGVNAMVRKQPAPIVHASDVPPKIAKDAKRKGGKKQENKAKKQADAPSKKTGSAKKKAAAAAADPKAAKSAPKSKAPKKGGRSKKDRASGGGAANS